MLHYDFKRDFFYDLLAALDTYSVSFLLGPRKCGKTIALSQIKEEYPNSIYIDFKQSINNSDEQYEYFNKIEESISNDESIIYLIDEITYAPSPEAHIARIANLFAENKNTKTKIIFAGSQSSALESWANRAFCGNVGKIRPAFLGYSEWLKFMNLTEISAETYNRFLYEAQNFYKIHSLKEYLEGCLEETIVSNNKTNNYILGNECNLIDTNLLVDLCYTTMFSLHNHTTMKTFLQDEKLEPTIRTYFKAACKELTSPKLRERIEASFGGSYDRILKTDLDKLKQGFLFLYRCGLLTLTPVIPQTENIPNIYTDLYHDTDKIKYKEDLFKKYNPCIAYPMFYVQILKDILQEYMPEELPKELLGSVTECYLRGLLPSEGCYEFHDEHDNEVDYVNPKEQLAIEFTVSNKPMNRTHFEIFDENYTKILLSKTINDEYQGTLRIPYYNFIHLLEKNKNSLNRLKDEIRNQLSQESIATNSLQEILNTAKKE